MLHDKKRSRPKENYLQLSFLPSALPLSIMGLQVAFKKQTALQISSIHVEQLSTWLW